MRNHHRKCECPTRNCHLPPRSASSARDPSMNPQLAGACRRDPARCQRQEMSTTLCPRESASDLTWERVGTPHCGCERAEETRVPDAPPGTVRVVGPKGERLQQVRTFGTTSTELLALRDSLAAHAITHVAMESTGSTGGATARRAPASPWTPTRGPPWRLAAIRSLAFQLHVLVGSREPPGFEETEPGCFHARPDAVEESEVPDRREHRSLVDELLDPVEDRLALRAI